MGGEYGAVSCVGKGLCQVAVGGWCIEGEYVAGNCVGKGMCRVAVGVCGA